MITQELLHQFLDYNHETGVFSWKKNKANVRAGSITGSFRPNGYLVIGFDGRTWRAHRLAWLYMTGDWPKNDIDHVDGNRANNAWANLREATRGQNLANMKRPSHNKSGLKGVCWDKGRGKWAAYIKINSKSIGLGRFATKEEAHEVYVRAAKSMFGEFARAA